jgi:hypothetical protein
MHCRQGGWPGGRHPVARPVRPGDGALGHGPPVLGLRAADRPLPHGLYGQGCAESTLFGHDMSLFFRPCASFESFCNLLALRVS